MIHLSEDFPSVTAMELWITTAAAGAAIVSGIFVALQVREMKRQTDQQREVAESTVQPYVWGDVRLQSRNGWNLEFVIGNSGPTVATRVVVLVDPPFPKTHEGQYVDVMHQKLSDGLASLAPGRTLHWTLGPSSKLVNRDGPLAHHVRIDCDGPYGAVATSEFVIDMADFRESVAHHDGTLVDIAKSIDKLTQALPDQRTPFLVEQVSAGDD